MIETLEDFKVDYYDTEEVIWQKIEEMIGVRQLTLTESLSAALYKKASAVAETFRGFAPYHDYGQFVDSHEKMTYFLQTEAHKSEHWDLRRVNVDEDKQLIVFKFCNLVIDDGKSLGGYVWVSKTGKIKHAFAQNES